MHLGGDKLKGLKYDIWVIWEGGHESDSSAPSKKAC